MRCDCCDHILKPSEATRKFKLSGDYTNTCDACLKAIADDENPYIDTVDGAGVDKVDDDDESESED